MYGVYCRIRGAVGIVVVGLLRLIVVVDLVLGVVAKVVVVVGLGSVDITDDDTV